VTHWFLDGRRWIMLLPLLLGAATLAAAGLTAWAPGVELDLSLATMIVWGFAGIVAILPALLFMLAGLLQRLFARPSAYRPFTGHPATRFVVIVPAYNEERVISNSVVSLLQQDYPPALFSVHVACNGRDDTARIARELGANVHETRQKGIGKSAAIAETLLALTISDDAYIVIFDADNLVAQGFLRALDRQIQAGGALALQGNHQPLPSSENMVSLGICAAYRASSMFYSVGRSRLLRSALLCGTGFAVQARLFTSIWARVRTQTEDIESNALLQLDHGLGVMWVEDAVFFDEKPDQVVLAIRQRVRWMVGHFHTALLYTAPLIRHGVRHRSLRSIELAVYYLFPIALFFSTVWYLLALPAMAVGLARFHPNAVGINLFCTGAGLVYVVGMPAIAALLEQRSIRPMAVALAVRDAAAALLVSMVVWSIAILLAAACLRRRDWIFHTPHKATVPVRSPT
jgi:cellulose synthase/poly-beta-1,6-N-acetylglucosamine synthase-like glycosyltransferase